MLRIEEHGPVIKLLMARPILGHAFYHTAAYWVDGLLVDTGCAFTAPELRQAVASLPLQQIVNTHCHEDHIGGNALLARARGVPILAHPLTLPILANPRRQYLQPYRRLFWGWPPPWQGRTVGQWVETARYHFRVIRTPGHSPDHIALYEPERGWLFSGDAFIGGQDRSARLDYDIYAIIDSLKTMAALDLSMLFPGSGTVRSDPVASLRLKIAALEELGAEARRLRAEGLGVQAIKQRLLGHDPYIRYLTLGHFSGSNLIRVYLRAGSTPGDAGPDG